MEEDGIITGALCLTRGFFSSCMSVCICFCGRWPFTIMSAHDYDVVFSMLSFFLLRLGHAW